MNNCDHLEIYHSTELGMMIKKDGKCPICNTKILIKQNESQILKGLITIFKEGTITTKCKQCKNMVNIPIDMITSLQITSKKKKLKDR